MRNCTHNSSRQIRSSNVSDFGCHRRTVVVTLCGMTLGSAAPLWAQSQEPRESQAPREELWDGVTLEPSDPDPTPLDHVRDENDVGFGFQPFGKNTIVGVTGFFLDYNFTPSLQGEFSFGAEPSQTYLSLGARYFFASEATLAFPVGLHFSMTDYEERVISGGGTSGSVVAPARKARFNWVNASGGVSALLDGGFLIEALVSFGCQPAGRASATSAQCLPGIVPRVGWKF